MVGCLQNIIGVNFEYKLFHYLAQKKAVSRILLMEHKYSPPPLFLILFIFCFYAYFRLGKG